jgi:hypothetical protein
MKRGLLLLGIIIPLGISAQILDVDDITPSTDSLNLKYSVFGAFQIDKPINFVYTARMGGSVSLSAPKHFVLADFNGGVTVSGGQQLLNGGTGHMRYRFLPQKRVHPELFVQGQWDGARGMKYRFLSGINCRFVLVKNERFESVAGTGFFYEQELWSTDGLELEGATDVVVKLPRFIKWNNYIQLCYRPSEKLQLKLTGFLQTRPDRFVTKPRVAVLFSTDVNLIKGLALALGIQMLWDAAPVIPIPQLYLNSSNNIGYAN